ncbi:MAG: ABC transporter ATP-binding protein [Promethearchaeati archaeon SRVP18_Atabeyarchaeia-1]
MIIVEGVWFTYPDGPTALRGVSLKIGDGELVAIMGENGAGKTTLIKCFNGLLKPQKGVVFINNLDTRAATVAQLARQVGFVFQNADHQLFSDTVYSEVAFALRNFHFPKAEAQRRIRQVLRSFDLEKYSKTSPFSLSGGERKRVALASTLCFDPHTIILDEPTIGQDGSQKRKLGELIKSFNRAGRTVIVVTHDVEFAADYASRVIAMAKGRIVGDGPTRKVLTDSHVLDGCALLAPQIAQLAQELSERVKGFPRDVISIEEAISAIQNFL